MALSRPDAAVRLFATADALRREVGAAPDSGFHVDREKREWALAQAREALGADVFSATWAAGAKLSLEAAVAEAMALIGPNAADDIEAASSLADGARLQLSARERELLRRLAAGESDKEIAAGMGLTRRTASNYVAAIRAKLGAPSRAAAAAIAVRDHLV